MASTVEALFRVLEERLAMPGVGESRESLSVLLAPEFREFGASGAIQGDVATILDGLMPAGRSRLVFEDFQAARVSASTVLVTYRCKSVPGPGWKPPALCSSLWVKRDGRWQMIFHQGTRLDTQA